MEHSRNSAGIELCRIEPGTFEMGSSTSGEADEAPVRKVTLTSGFWMSVAPVTNAQYELFDPGHREQRGRNGFSFRDNEAAVFISWQDAWNFCRWFSRREKRTYRLPTEAEWEYCCRAGTHTPYFTGDTLPAQYCRAQEETRDITPVELTVGLTPPNAFGLCDMHGLVEEWCDDWYASYENGEAVDPGGPENGSFKVTRGGSHNADIRFLTSSQRAAALPGDRSGRIGFRVVRADGPRRFSRHPEPFKRWQQDVCPGQCRWPGVHTPVFAEPISYIREPPDPRKIPFYSHNHCPSITWCDNGDLLAVWFSCERESGREMTILASRLRRGSATWDMPAEFFKVPDRNMTGSALYNNSKGTLYHFNGVSSGYDWADLALAMRTSTDNGVTWTRPAYADARHGYKNQAISGTLETADGRLLQPCDATPLGYGGTSLHVSGDGGKTWALADDGAAAPVFAAGFYGSRIAGIHAGVAELADGSLLALGRGDAIDGCMPMSRSFDKGRTWRYSASPFPPVGSGQRLVLGRLHEGPLLLVSFTDDFMARGGADGCAALQGMEGTDASGVPGRIFGMFASLSYDGGQTWPVKKLVGSGKRGHANGGAWTGSFDFDKSHAEPMGYLAMTQSPDGMIHLLSSRQYYRFNLAWLEQQAFFQRI